MLMCQVFIYVKRVAVNVVMRKWLDMPATTSFVLFETGSCLAVKGLGLNLLCSPGSALSF